MIVAACDSNEMKVSADAGGRELDGSHAEKGAISNKDLYSRGMKMLYDFLGIVDAEIFISMIKNDRYDYTEWRRGFYDKMTTDEFLMGAEEYAKTHPYKGDPATII